MRVDKFMSYRVLFLWNIKWVFLINKEMYDYQKGKLLVVIWELKVKCFVVVEVVVLFV